MRFRPIPGQGPIGSSGLARGELNLGWNVLRPYRVARPVPHARCTVFLRYNRERKDQLPETL